jgi:hypothetical protein
MLWVFLPLVLVLLCAYIATHQNNSNQVQILSKIIGVIVLIILLVNRMYS